MSLIHKLRYSRIVTCTQFSLNHFTCDFSFIVLHWRKFKSRGIDLPEHQRIKVQNKGDAEIVTAYFFLESDKTFFFIVLALRKRMGLWSKLGFILSPFQISENFLMVTMRVPSMQAKHILPLKRTKAQRGHKNCS